MEWVQDDSDGLASGGQRKVLDLLAKPQARTHCPKAPVQRGKRYEFTNVSNYACLALGLIELLKTINRNSVKHPDWIDAVSTAFESLPHGTANALASVYEQAEFDAATAREVHSYPSHPAENEPQRTFDWREGQIRRSVLSVKPVTVAGPTGAGTAIN